MDIVKRAQFLWIFPDEATLKCAVREKPGVEGADPFQLVTDVSQVGGVVQDLGQL